MKRRAALFGLACAGVTARAQPVDVSILSLIATPSAFHGQQIRCIGFARIQFEGTAIYLHKEDCLRGITKNGLWLDIGALPAAIVDAANDRYVIVEGRFSMTNHGHLGLWSGSIQNITRMDPLEP